MPKWLCESPSGRFLAVNDAALEYYGYSRPEFLALRMSDLGDPGPDGQQLPSQEGTVRLGHRRHRRKDGVPVDVALSAHSWQVEEGVRVLLEAADVTTTHSLEDQLRQAQKMEAVGLLAGGVAHDFNNMLSVVVTYGEMLLAQTAQGHESYEDLDAIVRAGKRAVGLTRQLLAFSRRQVLYPRVVDPNQAVTEMVGMLQRLVGEQVVLRTSTEAAGNIMADPTQLTQVVMNLAVNARDAMPRGGTLTIETESVLFDATYSNAHLNVPQGRYVMLAVSDTGVGMDQSTASRIFEPFFSTKKEKGTGLGLATVYGIIKQSNGYIWVYSEPGVGTTFKIYFPEISDAVAAPEQQQSQTVPVGNETILLVEDEEMVRALARRVLTRAGYRVLDVQNAGEALLVAEQEHDKLDLLLSDVVMPRMNGPQLAERVRRQVPGIRVIFMSGYTDQAVAANGIVEPGVNFIEKPLTPSMLLSKVREVLDAPGADGPSGPGDA